MVSKPEVEGGNLLHLLLGQTQDLGGAFSCITGGMGGGKTSAMFAWLIYNLLHYPDQKIFLSETYGAPLQCFKLLSKIPREKLHFMVMKNSNVVFRDRNKHLAEVNMHQTYFESAQVTDDDDNVIGYIPNYASLYEKALPGHINVVFFGDRLKWMDFMRYLRRTSEWNHIYIDELGEIAPAGTSGANWKRVGNFANFTKDIRKCMMKVTCNTQAVRDSDYRVWDKFMFLIFLPGSMKDEKHSRVNQGAIDNLRADPYNQAYISSKGKFGKIVFKDVFAPVKNFNIEAYVPTDFE